VRWKGYSPANDTWEPVDNLEVVEDMVAEFDKREEDKMKARAEERRLRKVRTVADWLIALIVTILGSQYGGMWSLCS
jgi:hypothetical protein